MKGTVEWWPSCGNTTAPKKSVIRRRDYGLIPLIRPITVPGTWLNPIIFTRIKLAEKTAFSSPYPNSRREELMLCASCSLSPSALVFFTLSLPARSQLEAKNKIITDQPVRLEQLGQYLTTDLTGPGKV